MHSAITTTAATATTAQLLLLPRAVAVAVAVLVIDWQHSTVQLLHDPLHGQHEVSHAHSLDILRCPQSRLLFRLRSAAAAAAPLTTSSKDDNSLVVITIPPCRG